MTTNYVDRLDPALIRPGRVDRKQYFGNATDLMIRKVRILIFVSTKTQNYRCLSDSTPTWPMAISVGSSSKRRKHWNSHCPQPRSKAIFFYINATHSWPSTGWPTWSNLSNRFFKSNLGSFVIVTDIIKFSKRRPLVRGSGAPGLGADWSLRGQVLSGRGAPCLRSPLSLPCCSQKARELSVPLSVIIKSYADRENKLKAPFISRIVSGESEPFFQQKI